MIRKLLITSIASAVAITFSACEADGDDDDHDHHHAARTTTTTTEETTVHQPAAATTETRTIRTY